jgi:hypothetical protein
MMSPIPWETEGISIGSAAKTPKSLLRRILQRDTQNAASSAVDIEMKLAAADTDTEFFAALHSLGEAKTALMSECVMKAIILASGSITAAVRKIMSRILAEAGGLLIMAGQIILGISRVISA